MFEHCWEITLRGSMLRRLPAGYLLEVVSHRLLRYASGLLHLLLLGSSLALVASGWVYALVLAAQLALLGAAAAGVPIARYYALVTWATVCARQLPPPRRPGHVGGGRGNALMHRARRRRAGRPWPRRRGPLLAAAALAVKLTDGGPVLFRQQRVGQDARDFELLKLRTMVDGAETLGAGFAVDKGDPRITRVGRLLRRTSIDELPQLVERPARRHVDRRAAADAPLSGRALHGASAQAPRRAAGLTGWAQVNGRAELPWADRIELDVWYVEHRSPALDLKILLRTPLALFGGTYKGDSGGWRGG